MNDFEKGYKEGYEKGRQDSVDKICKALNSVGRCISDRKLPNE